MSIFTRIRNGMEPDGVSGLGGATEGDIRGVESDIFDTSGGVVDKSGGHLLVHEAGTPGMSVEVDDGIGYIPNSAYDELDTDTVKFWEAVVSNENPLTIAANASGSTRIDKICLKMDVAVPPDEFASNIATLVVVQGTPGAGAPATPSNHLLLANVTVANGATSILDASISDQRVQILLKEAVVPIDADTATKSGTETLTNKRITPRVVTTASSATPTPNADTTDRYEITALAAAAAFAAPSGTPTDGQGLIIRVKDNGTARALTYNAIYRAVGVILPTTTIISKTLYLGMIYNAADTKWDIVAVAQES